MPTTDYGSVDIVERAHSLSEQITTGFKNFQAGNHYSYGIIGEALCLLRQDSLYKYLGHKTLDDAIRSIGKSRSICYAMMDYHEYITPLLKDYPQIQEIPVTLLTKDVVPMLRVALQNTGNAHIVQKLIDISALDEQAQKDEIRGLRGKVKHVDCDHKNTELWVKCKDCNKFIGPANKIFP